MLNNNVHVNGSYLNGVVNNREKLCVSGFHRHGICLSGNIVSISCSLEHKALTVLLKTHSTFCVFFFVCLLLGLLSRNSTEKIVNTGSTQCCTKWTDYCINRVIERERVRSLIKKRVCQALAYTVWVVHTLLFC